jgi:hypothetical protein
VEEAALHALRIPTGTLKPKEHYLGLIQAVAYEGIQDAAKSPGLSVLWLVLVLSSVAVVLASGFYLRRKWRHGPREPLRGQLP